MASCDRCGGYVSHDYVRVFGDNRNRIDACPDCRTGRTAEGSNASGEPEGERGLTFRMSEFESENEDSESDISNAPEAENEGGRFSRVSAAVSGLF